MTEAMSEFTLDTSGTVHFPAIIERTGDHDTISLDYRWSDLSPFEQGYVAEALKAANAAFHQLAPATLAAIVKDCGEFMRLYGEWPLPEHGRGFWEGRQKGKHSAEFWPQTLSLHDDGKIYLREGG